MTTVASRFELGRTVATANLLHALGVEDNPVAQALEIAPLLARHRRGDWGDVSEEDAQANEDAIVSGDRIMSIYHVGGRKVYVITDPVTTVCPSCWAGVGECEPDKGTWHDVTHFRDDLPPRRVATTAMLAEDY